MRVLQTSVPAHATPTTTIDRGDPHGLARFLRAQAGGVYYRALAEVRAGKKRTHWMWFVFPRFICPDYSTASRYYAIHSLAEAKVYLTHSVLGPRLVAVCEAAVALPGRTALEVFGPLDEPKLLQCAVLFASVSEPGSVFDRVLERYFDTTVE